MGAEDRKVARNGGYLCSGRSIAFRRSFSTGACPGIRAAGSSVLSGGALGLAVVAASRTRMCSRKEAAEVLQAAVRGFLSPISPHRRKRVVAGGRPRGDPSSKITYIPGRPQGSPLLREFVQQQGRHGLRVPAGGFATVELRQDDARQTGRRAP